MLSISIHASSPGNADRFNRLARLDIVYEQLSPVADYKVSLIARNQDARPPRSILQYPRWSASLWDLAARAIAISLPDEPPTAEQVPEFEPSGKRCAFIREMSAILDHSANDSRNTLGSVHIKQPGRQRGIYRATFEEHTLKAHRTEPFQFAPAYFRPAELLMHACLQRLSGTSELPARPGLCVPPPVLVEGKPYIQIHQLVEPARTGFRTWLNWFSEPALEHLDAPLGIAPETLYIKFLSSAI
jgi:hypothetical protein